MIESRNARTGALVVILSSLVALYPLIPGGIPNIADAALHLYRVVEFDAMLHRGVLYPRWASDLAFGYGYPLFNYYAPLLYYVVEAPHLLGLDFEPSLKIVVFATFVLYGVGAYWWIRPILGEVPAIVAGVAYVYVPTRFHEAYRQGDYPQFLALALAPVALGATYRLMRSKRLAFRWIAVLAVTMAAIVLTHNISALLLLPIVGGYALVLGISHAPGAFAASRLAAAAGAAALSMGLAAFFWLPALIERSVVHLDNLITDDFDVRNHFTTVSTLLEPPRVVDQTATNPPSFSQIGWGHLGLALVGTTIVLYFVLRRKSIDRPLGAHLVIGWVILFIGAGMTLPPSAPVWRHVPLLAYTEYPTRFLGVGAVGSALLAGICACAVIRIMDELSPSSQHQALTDATIVAVGMILLIGPCLVYLYVDRSIVADHPLTPADAIAFERTVGAVGTTSAGEYYPLDVTKPPKGPLPANLDAIGRLDRSSLPPSSTVTFLGHAGYIERYKVDLPGPSTVRFNLIRFPGWHLSVDGQVVGTEPSPGDGLLLATIPGGTHDVSLTFADTTPRRIGWAITLASAGALIALVLAGLVRHLHARPAATDLAHKPPQSRGGTLILVPSYGAKGRSLSQLRSGSHSLIVGCLIGLAFLALRAASPGPYAAVFARQSPVDRVIGISHPKLVRLEDKVEFLGYDVDANTATPGQTIGVTLYWRALVPLVHDYRSLAMIATVDQRNLLTQDDRVHPGGIPTRAWRTDHFTIDRHEIPIPAAATAMVYQLQVALYDPATGAHLQQYGVEGFAGQQIVLDRVHVRPSQPVDLTRFRSAGDAVFGDLIALQGYQVSGDHVKPGQSLQVSFVWRANRPIDHDYTVFVHLVDANQKQVAGRDSVPLNGQYPTSQWIVGDQVVDSYEVAIPTTVIPGRHHLSLGFYDPASMQRLDAIAKDWSAKRSQVDLDVPIMIDGN